MDGSLKGKNACEPKMDKVLMGMGKHWEMKAFIVDPQMQYSFLLGIEWLCTGLVLAFQVP